MKKDLKMIFMKIEESYDIKDLFSYALYHKYNNVKRVYLDVFELKGVQLFLFLINFICDIMKNYFSETMYICLVSFDNENMIKLPKEKIKSLKLLDINIPKASIKKQYYLEEDEFYVTLYFFEEKFQNINKYIWGLLACNFSEIEPCLQMSMFFISKDLTSLVNVYDDRGMDIMKLDIKNQN